MLFFTGDIHGSHSIGKLSSRRWPRGRTLTRDDFLVICGDFGLVWSQAGARGWKEDAYWLDWLESKPWTTLFVDGNHENFDILDAMPETEWNGGMVHKVRPHVLHLMRGYVFDIPVGGHTETLLSMGGARSHDIEWRTEGVSWWPREMPSESEVSRCREASGARDWHVDWVVTHDVPGRYVNWLHGGPRLRADGLESFLDELDGRLSFRVWYSGHWHTDIALGNGHAALYNEIVAAGEMPSRKLETGGMV